MARNRSKRGGSRDNKFLIIIVAVVAVVLFGAFAFKNFSTDSESTEDDFVGDAMGKYVERGSSAVGNSYKIQATVTDVYSHGENRIFKVQTRDSKSLGLFVPGGTKLDANVRAGMEYVFEVEGRNGTKPDGSSVKGVLIVKQAKAK